MKKTKTSFFKLTTIYFSFICCVYSQKDYDIQKTKFPSFKDFNIESNVIFHSEINNGDKLICIKEKKIKLSNNALYTFLIYDRNQKLIHKSNLKQKQIHSVFYANDSIHLIRLEKKIVKENPNNRFEVGFSPLKRIDYYVSSSPLDSIYFNEKKWFSKHNKENEWSSDPYKYNIVFRKDLTTNNIFHLSSFDEKTEKKVSDTSVIKITVNNTLKGKENYKTDFFIDIFGTNKKKKFTKKVTAVNNMGEFRIEKIKVDYDIRTTYLLLSTKKGNYKTISTSHLNTNNFIDPNIETKYHLIKISPEKNSYITLEDIPTFIKVANMELYNDQIIIAGLYSKTYNTNPIGSFKFNYNKQNLEINTSNYSNFSPAFLKNIRNKYYGEYLTNNFLLSDYIFIDKYSGDCIINIEVFSLDYFPLKTTRFSLTKKPIGYSHRNQKGIISIKINNKNQVKWERFIRTKSKKNFDYYSKYIDGVNYLIGDNIPKIHKIFNKSDKRNYLTNYLYSISIDPDGNITSKRFGEYDPVKLNMNILNNYKDNSIYTYDTSNNLIFYLKKYSWESKKTN